MAGMRGPLYDAEEWERPRRELGFDVIPCEELRELTPAAYGERVRAGSATRPCSCRSTSTSIDPCLAPGTGTPEAAGLLPYEALRFVRALAGLPLRRLRRGRGVAAAGRARRADGDPRRERRVRVPRD